MSGNITSLCCTKISFQCEPDRSEDGAGEGALVLATDGGLFEAEDLTTVDAPISSPFLFARTTLCSLAADGNHHGQASP